MPKWNFVAMGQVGLTGWTRTAAQPVARAIARRTGRPEAQILALIGAAFLAIALIDFLRGGRCRHRGRAKWPSASQTRQLSWTVRVSEVLSRLGTQRVEGSR